MDQKQLNHFENLLVQMKSELIAEVSKTVRHLRDDSANFPDQTDRATIEEEFGLLLRTRDRDNKLMKRIDLTISRIHKRDYGYCISCDEPIGIKRLLVRPTALQCIKCKERDEFKEDIGGI